MRLTLSNSLALLTVITAMTMTGCSDERVDPAAGVVEINTDHYFFNEQKIWIFNPETELSREVDTFDEGENKLISLDTDLKKQGFEYMAYVKSNGVNQEVFLKAYEKGSAAPKRLIHTANHICGIYPRKAAADEDVTELDPSEVITQDLYLIDVVTNADESCDEFSSQYYAIDISYLKPRSEGDPFKVLSIQETSSAFVLGTMLRNFSPIGGADPETAKSVHWGYIGYDTNSKGIQLYNRDFKLLWTSPIETQDSIPHFFQATNELAVIQSDQRIYVRKISTLFDLGRKENLDGSELPTNSVIATLFRTHDLITSSADALHPVSVRKDNSNFVLKDGKTLRYYNLGFDSRLLYPESPNISDFEFSVISGSPSQVIINVTVTDDAGLPDHKNLLAVNSLTFTEATLASAKEIQYKVIGDELYVNTFKEAGLNSWQAHHIVSPGQLAQSKTTYNLSLFSFAKDYRDDTIYPLMLRSSNFRGDGALDSPEVGPFSPRQEDGLYSGNIFGAINESVKMANLPSSPDFVLNEIYGGLFIQSDDDDAQHMFFFNLQEAKNSLKQMY